MAIPTPALPPNPRTTGGTWSLCAKDYFNQRGARISCYDFHRASGVLVTGLSTGIFDLHQLPSFEPIQTLSISRERITSLAFNAAGDWIAGVCVHRAAGGVAERR